MPAAISVALLLVAEISVGVDAGLQAGDRSVISGRIVNRLGCPLIAEFKLRPGTAPFADGALQATRSDAEGRFEFRSVEPGRYWIHYVLNDGGWGGDGVVVDAGGANKDFNWPAPFVGDVQDLEFLVTDREGNPLAGVKVTWRRFSGAIDGPACGSEVVTDVAGRARLNRAASGTYRITVERDGFAPRTRDVKFGSGYETAVTFRLLTPPEAEKEGRTVLQGCFSSHETSPRSLPELISRADAIVVGRIATAVLDPDYRGEYSPTVLTRYDVHGIEILKPHPQLTGASVPLTHLAGEMEWGDKNIVGCSGLAMRSGETYVLFLTWDDQRRTFTPLSGSAYIVNITSGEVGPIRLSYTLAPALHEHKGQTAVQFLTAIKAVLKNRI